MLLPVADQQLNIMREATPESFEKEVLKASLKPKDADKVNQLELQLVDELKPMEDTSGASLFIQ